MKRYQNLHRKHFSNILVLAALCKFGFFALQVTPDEESGYARDRERRYH